MNALKGTLLELLKSSFNGFDTMVSDAEGVLTGSGSSAFNQDNMWAYVLTIADILKPFCYVIIGICLMLEIAQVLAKVDLVRWEHGLKLAIKMVYAKLCIDTAPEFLKACFLQASEWITSATSAGAYSDMGALISTEVQTAVDEISGLWSVIGLMASCLLLTMAIKVCGLLVQVIAFGRMFELYVYLAVSPLPCAFFPLGDGSGGGISRITQKFFKSFIAVCLQGVMIIICIRIYNMMVGTAIGNMISNVTSGSAGSTTIVSDLCYTMLMGAVVLVMAVAKCGSWAKGILDAM